jgi:predicted dithiol-disulfide oxidoreductase (DUF899 family)
MVASQVHFPGESAEYREARNRLLDAEIELRRATEAVAEQRRALPPGGLVPEDYVFEEATGAVRLSELFAPGKDTLVVYGYMYGPDWEAPCPSCSSIVDSLDGAAPHLTHRVNLVGVAKAPIEMWSAVAQQRGWRHLRLLSSGGSTFNRDYHAETAEGHQMPIMNVFRRDRETGEIRHFWGAELTYGHEDPGQEGRSVDFLWPIWNVLDVTPEGRGDSLDFPKLTYDG